MAEKRMRSNDDHSRDHSRPGKKVKRGFVVGPENLPDGPYKRKNQKIKSALIQRAKIKKDYAKLKRQGKIPDEAQNRHPSPPLENENEQEEVEEAHEPSTTPHPDRQTLMNNPHESPELEETAATRRPRKRKPKHMPFKREYEQAQQRKADAEERRQAREEAERQRRLKSEERERYRKAMEKAKRGGPNGQRKLGRESKVLLEKVKRMVGEEG